MTTSQQPTNSQPTNQQQLKTANQQQTTANNSQRHQQQPTPPTTANTTTNSQPTATQQPTPPPTAQKQEGGVVSRATMTRTAATSLKNKLWAFAALCACLLFLTVGVVVMIISILLCCPKPVGRNHCKTTVITNWFINSCCF